MDLKEAQRIYRNAISAGLSLDDDYPRGALVSIVEAADRAQMNPQSIWRLIRRGELRAFGRRGALRVSMEELLPQHQPNRKST
jgi:hypothetical protein